MFSFCVLVVSFFSLSTTASGEGAGPLRPFPNDFFSSWKDTTWLKAVAAGIGAYAAKELYHRSTEKDLKGEAVVITGAASGIGKLLAVELAKRGCRVALWDLNDSTLTEVVDEIRSFGGEARGYVADVTNRTQVYDAARRALSDFGRVDILINNAGIASGQPFLRCSDDIMEQTMHVNTISHFWTIKSFLPGMLERNHGHVVTVASMAGLAGTAGLVDYSASKFGAVGIAESLAMELRKMGMTGVHSTCVCPFFVRTGMFEGVSSRFGWLIPLLDPEYVALEIVKAIQQKRMIVMMPRFCYPGYVLKACLPRRVGCRILELLGASDSMDGFVQTRSY